MKVYLVMRDFPGILEDVERIFFKEEAAINYLQDRYPHFIYLASEDAYLFEDYDKDCIDEEERYYVIERETDDDP